ncbi:MAG TPA: hypothetical protein VMV69_30125 [Pirellulales bacterium]|nr:hypothetical protein [Pirellulales bacterium]
MTGQPLRAADGRDNGVRLVDLNDDGYLDVLISNPELQRFACLTSSATALWISSVGSLILIFHELAAEFRPGDHLRNREKIT